MEVVRSLNYFVRRFECNRKNMRLNIQSGASLAPNDLVRIQLPSNALIDLSTFQLTSDLTVTNSAVASSLSSLRVTGTHNLIKRCNVVIGGVNVGSSDNHFGKVREAWKRAAYSQDWNDSNVASNQNLQRSATVSTAAVADNDLNGGGHRAFDYWALSAMNINGSGILDTSIFGDCSIEIQFDSKYALNGPFATDNPLVSNIDWSGANLRAYVDCLFLPNGDYAAAVRDRLVAGGEVRAIVPNIVSSIQKNSSANEFNVSTQCLAGVMVAGLHPTYTTNFNNRFVSCNAGGTVSTAAELGAKSYHLEIGSETYPAYGNVNDGRDGANMTRNMVGKNSPYNYNQLYHTHTATQNLGQDNNQAKTQTNYAAQNFIVGFDTSLEGLGALHDSKLMSGVSTQGGNSVIRFISTSFDETQYWLFAGLCDAELIARKGQVVNFVA